METVWSITLSDNTKISLVNIINRAEHIAKYETKKKKKIENLSFAVTKFLKNKITKME